MIVHSCKYFAFFCNCDIPYTVGSCCIMASIQFGVTDNVASVLMNTSQLAAAVEEDIRVEGIFGNFYWGTMINVWSAFQ